MKCLLSILFFSSVIAIPAQNGVIDSLKVALTHAKEDTNKVKTYSELSFAFVYMEPDTAILYASTGLTLASKLDFKSAEPTLLTTLGEALAQKGNLIKALEIKLEALRKAEKLNLPLLVAKCNNFLGANYYYSQDYRTALVYYYKAKTNKQWYTTFQKEMVGQIAHCYLLLGSLDSASKYAIQAYDLDRNDVKHWNIVYRIMGKIEDAKGNFPKALDFFKQASEIEGGPNPGMAEMFKKMGRTDSAIYYAKEVFMNAEAWADYYAMLDAGRLLTDLYKSRHVLDSAFKYQELMLATRDSLYGPEKIRQILTLEFNEQQRREQLEQQRIEKQRRFETRIKVYSLLAGVAVLAVISFLLYRNNRHKQKAKDRIEKAYDELRSTQAQLIQREKMASLGELTAGIAHEIQNPLNFVNNFSEVSNEMIDEIHLEIDKGNTSEAKQIATDIKQNLQKINHHGRRADAIVKGMLQHSRTSSGQKEPTDINRLADEYLRLAYHGLRAKDKSINVNTKTEFDNNIGKVNIVPQEIGRVILNLINNAFYTVSEKQKQGLNGYEPTVSVSTVKHNGKIEIKIKDNGNGIPQKVLDKIFQPFFTTKPTGQGTGLGLSLAYDIITKGHRGELKVETKEGEGSEFIISLPV